MVLVSGRMLMRRVFSEVEVFLKRLKLGLVDLA
jgi:hypothetical protein